MKAYGNNKPNYVPGRVQFINAVSYTNDKTPYIEFAK